MAAPSVPDNSPGGGVGRRNSLPSAEPARSASGLLVVRQRDGPRRFSLRTYPAMGTSSSGAYPADLPGNRPVQSPGLARQTYPAMALPAPGLLWAHPADLPGSLTRRWPQAAIHACLTILYRWLASLESQTYQLLAISSDSRTKYFFEKIRATAHHMHAVSKTMYSRWVYDRGELKK